MRYQCFQRIGNNGLVIFKINNSAHISIRILAKWLYPVQKIPIHAMRLFVSSRIASASKEEPSPLSLSQEMARSRYSAS